MPKKTGSKNPKGTSVIAFLNCFCKISFGTCPVTSLIEYSSSSYMPKINAIVPPDTPGTRSAKPIEKPVKNKRGVRFILPSFVTIFFMLSLLFLRMHQHQIFGVGRRCSCNGFYQKQAVQTMACRVNQQLTIKCQHSRLGLHHL